MSDVVRFELLGGSFRTDYGRNKQKQKVYFDFKKAAKNGVREEQVLRWNDGMPIGVIELSTTGQRVLTVPKTEVDFIEALKHHEMCLQSPFKSDHAKLRYIDDDEVRAKTSDSLKLKKKATLVWINLNEKDKLDFYTIMGYGNDEVLADEKSMDYAVKYPENFLEFFTEPDERNANAQAKLKEKYKVEALLKRATQKGIVKVEAGAYKFEGKVLGSSLSSTVNNLMNTNKGDESALAYVLPLILDKLKK
jgi:hypothetical protein